MDKGWIFSTKRVKFIELLSLYISAQWWERMHPHYYFLPILFILSRVLLMVVLEAYVYEKEKKNHKGKESGEGDGENNQ